MHFLCLSCSVDSADLGIKSSGSSTPLEDNINVVVRVRPVSDKEIKARDESVVQFPGNGQILVRQLIEATFIRIPIPILITVRGSE